jgi:sensor histidine kinase YesM
MALRAAMNPHFIFNTLNSIQYFIMKNDQLNAVNYLSTFSKLIRGILSNSIKNRIRLQEELELLKYYVNLELLRFDSKFEFVLDIDPDLDVANIEIPSMLIQPYVENAILHGLYNKKEKGVLSVSVRDVGDAIIFQIQDNGVGREAAAKLKPQGPGHKSLGTQITEERLKIINAESGIAAITEDVEIDGLPAGTRVTITVKA